MIKLSIAQRRVLQRAVDGEDHQIPETFHEGSPPWIMPARHWYVPPGYLVPNGSDYVCCRVLVRKGLMKHDHVRTPKHPTGLGGYAITGLGRQALTGVIR